MVGEQANVEVVRFDWSEEIVNHIARHGVTPGDVEHVLVNGPRFFRNLPGRAASHVMIGRDRIGRVLYVPIRCVEPPGIWSVVSAWESRYARRLIEPN